MPGNGQQIMYKKQDLQTSHGNDLANTQESYISNDILPTSDWYITNYWQFVQQNLY